MTCEIYTLEYDGKRLRMEESKHDALPFDLPGKKQAGQSFHPGAPWVVHSCLGDDNRVWCEVLRVPGQPGGLFVLRDFDELLLLAVARSNLDFMEGLGHFARLTTYARYAADVFEHADDDDDDD